MTFALFRRTIISLSNSVCRWSFGLSPQQCWISAVIAELIWLWLESFTVVVMRVTRIPGQQTVDVCAQLASKFNQSDLMCVFLSLWATYAYSTVHVLHLQHCTVCVLCVYQMFCILEPVALQMCPWEREGESHGQGHMGSPCAAAWGLVNWLHTTILSLCVSVWLCW